MRHGKLLYISAPIAAFFIAITFSAVKSGVEVHRYHQHMEEPGEADLSACTDCDGAQLCTHLPIIRIETGGKNIPGRPDLLSEEHRYELSEDGGEDIVVSVSTVETKGSYHHADDPATLTSEARFRVRGDSSRRFSKASYRMILTEDGNPDDKKSLPLLGMSKGNEWALHGPFLDKTLIRNYMLMNLSAEVMGGYAPAVRFCELIIDGEYQGLYLLEEMIDVDNGKVELTEYEEGDLVLSYLVRLNNYERTTGGISDFGFYTRKWDSSVVEILYPPTRYQTEYVENYISADLSEFQKLIYSVEMINGIDSYKDFIDVDSFVNSYIFMEFIGETDYFNKSTYFYKDLRGKLHAGPLWDFNNSLNNNASAYLSARAFFLAERSWYERFMLDSDFVEKVIKRYTELRGGVLSEERLVRYATEVELWLGSAIERNYEVWGYSFNPDNLTKDERLNPNYSTELTIYELNPSSHYEAMNLMIDYMIDRGRWLDENIESLRQYSHQSRYALWSLE